MVMNSLFSTYLGFFNDFVIFILKDNILKKYKSWKIKKTKKKLVI